ncbi:MAG: ArpU family phage packaging/lysis transcriptional regulator [Paenisporosarcina sp.]
MFAEILDQLDNEATQEAVEKELRQYRTYLLTVPEDRMPSLTAQYTLEMPNFSNVKQSAVENTAVANVDNESERGRFLKRISRSMNKLTWIERQIIAYKYLQMEPWYNLDIYLELKISRSKFYRLRNSALYRLAFAMGVEKYKEEDVAG